MRYVCLGCGLRHDSRARRRLHLRCPRCQRNLVAADEFPGEVRFPKKPWIGLRLNLSPELS